MSNYIPSLLAPYLNLETLGPFIKALLTFIVGFKLSSALSKRLRESLTSRYSAQHGLIGGQVVFYGGTVLFATAALNQIGFSLTPLLGAAGVVGVALGFASQTSVSNIISGLFILAEQPFKVDDVITVGDVTGVVLSLDLLSVKLRAFDNRFIRIPHETIIKSQVINITRFPIRRVDVEVPVAYKEDIAAVKSILFDIVAKDPRILKQPEPIVFFKGFGNSSIDLLLLVWAETSEWYPVRNSLPEVIKARFDALGIEIPFPHLTLYPGSWDEPLPLGLHQRTSN